MTKKILLIFLLLILPSVSQATIYYQDTCESYTIGSAPQNPPWCNVPCGNTSCPWGTFQTTGAVQGSKFLTFTLPDDTASCCFYIGEGGEQNFPVTDLLNKTLYIGYLVRFERIGGNDIWQDGANCNNADKGVEILGTGMRWDNSHGCGWAGGYASDHHWTIWMGNAGFHLNRDNPYCPDIEGEGTSDDDTIQANQGGYSQANPYNLEYEKWYSVVFMLHVNTMSGGNPVPDGELKLWVDGYLLGWRQNMCVTADAAATITRIQIGGTIAQGTGGLAPSHIRQFDDFIITDAITDIDGTGGSFNFFADPEGEGDTTPPTVTNVTSDKTNGNYKAGEVIDIDVTFSEAVTSTGNVTVTLETGTTDRTCTFTVSGATTGTCNYTVQAGDTSSDLTVATNGIAGVVKDAAENAMTTPTNPTTNLAANKALVIDTTAPSVTISTSDPSNIISDYLSISGTASDAVGVTSCKYRIGAAPDGSNGTVITGTTSWSGAASGFSSGANTLYVGCTDAAGNWGSDSITVNYNPAPAAVRNLSITGGGGLK